MRMILFGATGGTGQALLTQALAHGHHVTAVVRRPDTVQTQHPQLTLVQGDVLQTESFATSMADQDVVLSALGVRNSRKPTTLYSAGTGSMLAAMQQHGVRRLLCITSSGVPRDPGMPWWYRRLVKPLIQPIYDDMARMEALVHASATAWTIVRPGYLTNGTRTEQYRVRIDTAPPGGWRIARADVADFMLKQAATAGYLHTAVGITY